MKTSGVCCCCIAENPFKLKLKTTEKDGTQTSPDIVPTEDSVMRNESGTLAKLANQELAC